MRQLALVLIAAGMLASTSPATANDGGPTATASRSCTPPAYPGNGSFTSLSVKSTSCSAGGKLAVSFYKCRVANGPSGRCVKKVSGYACQEVRTASPTQIDSRVTCRNGKRRVVHSYRQTL